ncbi:hypothetical protein RUM43_011304 [Polyplax serrata]|uniref:Uncharacterized protein n=1 Tax=Polyplax serrata TaxID=468196 RepID=A0AAN8S7T6_POLSC
MPVTPLPLRPSYGSDDGKSCRKKKPSVHLLVEIVLGSLSGSQGPIQRYPGHKALPDFIPEIWTLPLDAWESFAYKGTQTQRCLHSDDSGTSTQPSCGSAVQNDRSTSILSSRKTNQHSCLCEDLVMTSVERCCEQP